MVESVQRVVHRAVVLRLDDGLRHRHVDLLEQSVERGRANLICLLGALELAHLVVQAGPQLVDGVELAGQLRELVVGLRQFAFFDRPDGGGDLRLLPSVFAGRELRGELAGFVDGRADQRIVEAIDEPA